MDFSGAVTNLDIKDALYIHNPPILSLPDTFLHNLGIGDRTSETTSVTNRQISSLA